MVVIFEVVFYIVLVDAIVAVATDTVVAAVAAIVYVTFVSLIAPLFFHFPVSTYLLCITILMEVLQYFFLQKFFTHFKTAFLILFHTLKGADKLINDVLTFMVVAQRFQDITTDWIFKFKAGMDKAR